MGANLVEALQAGESFIVPGWGAQLRPDSLFPVQPLLQPGTYTVRLTVDFYERIAESDEGNNTFVIPQTLTIIAP